MALKTNRGLLALAAGTLLWVAAMAESAPTKVMVRAVSRDAKIIGSGVGGAKITVRDASSGEVLAEGVQSGGTGDTQKIIIEPHARHASIYDTPGAAGFLAELSLDRPTMVEIEAEGPLGYPQATATAVKTLLLAPGQDILGDGVLLEIHGFIVDLRLPEPGESWSAGQETEVRATVRMT